MRLNNRFKLNEVAGGYMLLDTAGGTVSLNRVFSMNEAAAWLWRQIGDREFDEPMLVDMICREYGVSRGVAGSDVAKMVRLWREFGMLLP